MDVFIDPRDNNSYKVVKINNLYWFAENLKYTGIEHYFPDTDSDNVEKYGCLYTWDNAKKACPNGWRLPTVDELLSIVGTGYHSKCIRDSSWKNGSNSTGFSALPAGYRSYFGAIFSFGIGAFYWSSERGPRYIGTLDVYDSDVTLGYNDNTNDALSARYIKEIN